ncbi:MAG TPA: hypothetical protein K8V84_11275 [Nocardiopsis listeri]|uniref:hypothetical protein n=1 Tax=Nocardiopsis listeri TaxID=53440 RepID=UPI001D953713|nr:hypothetical protein [Nocardiopsis listeri]HJE59071.1 hypothetical protein [Nocardiopsis listeri]
MALSELHTFEDLFDSPRRTSASISPDGTRMAFLPPWRNRLDILVRDLEPGSGPRPVTADETRPTSPSSPAPMRPVTITDRDGPKSPSYLILPVGIAPTASPRRWTSSGSRT